MPQVVVEDNWRDNGHEHFLAQHPWIGMTRFFKRKPTLGSEGFCGSITTLTHESTYWGAVAGDALLPELLELMDIVDGQIPGKCVSFWGSKMPSATSRATSFAKRPPPTELLLEAISPNAP